MFEPGLIERLQEEFPALNVSELAQGCTSANNPNSALIAKCRRVAASLEAQSRPTEPPPQRFWNSQGQLKSDHETPTHRFVLKLVRARLASSSFSPALAVKYIESESMEDAFGSSLAHWRDLPEAWQWPAADTSTGAADCVKRATMLTAPNGQRYWPDPSRGSGISPEDAKALVADMVKRLGMIERIAPQSLPAPSGNKVHGQGCTCEVCFAPWHEWAITHGMRTSQKFL